MSQDSKERDLIQVSIQGKTNEEVLKKLKSYISSNELDKFEALIKQIPKSKTIDSNDTKDVQSVLKDKNLNLSFILNHTSSSINGLIFEAVNQQHGVPFVQFLINNKV